MPGPCLKLKYLYLVIFVLYSHESQCCLSGEDSKRWSGLMEKNDLFQTWLLKREVGYREDVVSG